MSKLLLLIVVAIAAWCLIQRVRSKGANEDERGSAARGSASEQMVTCSHCGLYLPQKEAVSEDDKFFCCTEHRRSAG